jgi:hypothetical protein
MGSGLEIHIQLHFCPRITSRKTGKFGKIQKSAKKKPEKQKIKILIFE